MRSERTMHGMMSVRVGDSERAVSLPSRRALSCASDHGLNQINRRAPRRAPSSSRSDSAATFTNRLRPQLGAPRARNKRSQDEGTRDHGAELLWILSQGHAGGDEKHARQVSSARHEGYPTLGTRSISFQVGTPHSDRYPPRPSQGIEDRCGAPSEGRGGVALRRRLCWRHGAASRIGRRRC